MTTPTQNQPRGKAAQGAGRFYKLSDGTLLLVEHEAIEIAGMDGKTHQVWAKTAKDAYEQATKWGYRHGGLDEVRLMLLQDEQEGCWERAKRVPFSRQCNLALIVEKALS